MRVRWRRQRVVLSLQRHCDLMDGTRCEGRIVVIVAANASGQRCPWYVCTICDGDRVPVVAEAEQPQ